MELTVQNVYGLLLRSKLMPLDEARAMYARWRDEAGANAANLAPFIDWMVANRFLTTYQATLLARGHAEGFFLDGYKILDRLGKGRMAGVYKAHHPLGQTVAIKVLPPSKAQDAEMLARFLREGKLAIRLKHPNIVRTFLLGKANDIHYLVMEYLEGETLEDAIARRGPLTPTEGVRLIYQALQGLQHMHSQSLIHRDLKPSNIMIVNSTPDSTSQATLKILDIGLGRSLFEQGAADLAADPELTTFGAILGTPDYMAPEQARDPRLVDIRSDIYSLGCVLYFMLTGQPPFPDTNVISQMIRHATEPPPLLKERNPAVPDGLQQIVSWMLAKEPEQRYPTPERAAQALQVFLAGATSPLVEPESDPKMQSFLKWVEGRQPVDTKKTAVVPAPANDGTSQRPPPAKPDPPRGSPSEPVVDHKKKGTPLAPIVKTTAPRGSEAPSAADVELIATGTDTRALQGRRTELALSRRDLILFGVGVTAGAVAAIVGCVAALRGRTQ